MANVIVDKGDDDDDEDDDDGGLVNVVEDSGETKILNQEVRSWEWLGRKKRCGQYEGIKAKPGLAISRGEESEDFRPTPTPDSGVDF